MSSRRFVKDALLRLGEALRYVAHVESLLALGTVSLVLGLIDQAAGFPDAPEMLFALGSRGAWAAYFYLVFRKAAAGSRRLPIPSDYRATWETLIQPLTQGLAASSWYLVLLGVLVRATIGIDRFVQEFRLRALEFFRWPLGTGYGLLLFTLIQLPPAIIASACPESTALQLLDPSYGIRTVWRTPESYLVIFAALQFLVVASFLTGTMAGLLEQTLPVPVAAPVLRQLLQLWVSLAQARLLGDFVAKTCAQRQNALLTRHLLAG